MKCLILPLALTFIVSSLCLSGCGRKGQSLNEGLRLTPTEVQEYKSKALQGDAVAAKKLWQHYDAVEGNATEGEKWKSLYYKLDHDQQTQTPATSSGTPES